MTPEELRDLYDHDQRINLREPGVRAEATPFTVRQINENEPDSFLIYSKLTPYNLDAVISDEITFFEGISHNFEWKVFSHDYPPDLVERLAARGFQTDEQETILVLDMADLSGVLAQPITHDIRRVTDPAGVKPLLDVQAEVWNEDNSGHVERLMWELENHPDYISLYGAYVDDKLVSSAWMRFTPDSQFASLWGGSTLEAYRGRGVYTALVAARVQEAVGRGRRFLTIDASDMSRPIVQKLGFVPICTSTPCRWQIKR